MIKKVLVVLAVCFSFHSAFAQAQIYSYWQTRSWYGTQPGSGVAIRDYINQLLLSAPSSGFCDAYVNQYSGLSNQGTCGGTNSSIAYKFTGQFYVDPTLEGVWSFDISPDFGGGGAWFIDGSLIEYYPGDIWETHNFTHSLNLTTGYHVVEVFGFENCCDGGTYGRYLPPGGAWQYFPSTGVPPALVNCDITVNGSTSDQIYCGYQDVAASVPNYPGATYSWSNEGASATVGLSLSETTILSATITTATQTCSDQITLAVNPLSTWYGDADADGFGDVNSIAEDCTQPSGFVPDNADCNDLDATTYPGAQEICFDQIDNNCDGLIDENCAIYGCIIPNACNFNPQANTDDGSCILPQPEVCNDLDDNCNDQVDEGLEFLVYYNDNDGDGEGGYSGIIACAYPLGSYVLSSGDCDDGNAAINHNAMELCGNGIDDNCNSILDDGFLLGCTDVDAFNFDANATCDNGSCVAKVMGCVQIDACNYNELANTDDGSCVTLEVYSSGNNLCENIPVTLTAQVVGLPSNSGVVSYSQPISGFTGPVTYGGNTYYLSNNTYSWQNARQAALSLGADLAVVNNAQELVFLQNFVSQNGASPWVGLYQNTSAPNFSEPAGGWYWLNGEAYSFSWAGSEPNECAYCCGSPENSGQLLTNGTFNDLCINFGNRFLMEFMPVTNYNVQWSNGMTGEEILVNNSGSNTYVATLTWPTGSCSSNLSLTSLNVQAYYADADGDGFGNPSIAVSDCTAPNGFVNNNSDCNDSNASINSNAFEVCDDWDNDCDGLINEGLQPNTISSINISTALFPACSSGNLFSANLNTGTNSAIIAGDGPDLWYKLVAQYNTLRAGLSAASGNNSIGIYREYTGCLQLVQSENETTTGMQTLLSDALQVGATYYIAVHQIATPTNTSAKICFNHFVPSTCDHVYSANTGVYSNVCLSFKAQFRANATNYIFNVLSATQNGSNLNITPWSYTTPTASSIVTRLGTLLPANMSASNRVYTINVPVVYNLPDAAGNISSLTANATSTCTVTLQPETGVTLRTTDRCPNIKAINQSIATDRSICGTLRYEWEFTQTAPTAGLPVTVLGGLNSTALFLNTVPGMGNGKTYNVRVRPIHTTGEVGNYGAVQCMKTTGAGMILENHPSSAGAELPLLSLRAGGEMVSLFPNPTVDGQVTLLWKESQEGSKELVLRDVQGRIVWKQKVVIEGNVLELDWKTLDTGIYLLEVDGQTMRVVKG